MIDTDFHCRIFVDNPIRQQLIQYVGTALVSTILLTPRIDGTIIWRTVC